MRVAIGLPNSHAGVSGSLLVEWARRADALGFSALGTIGRMTYDNHEELTLLAAAAAVSNRIELMTTVLLGPARDAALLGKQAATIQSLSGGRFRLGLGVGERQDDYQATAANFPNRGRQLEEQITLMRQMALRQPVRGAQASIGPYRPFPIILGGRGSRAIERAGQLGDGYLCAPASPEVVRHTFDKVRQAWGSRDGQPYLGASGYFVLGDVAAGEEHVRDYYGFSNQLVEAVLQGLARSADDVQRLVGSLQESGAEELFLWPVSSELSELDRLAGALGLS
jgi:alkanesulfonate monooxygenase SsuD/methylene tetrahydromethanopterin reductase-like flavin-dependent oxidoreductase (luciferase family)